MFCGTLVLTNFAYIHSLVYLTGTGASMWLPFECQWVNPEEYGKIIQMIHEHWWYDLNRTKENKGCVHIWWSWYVYARTHIYCFCRYGFMGYGFIHISILCSKASIQINAMKRIGKYLNTDCRIAMYKSFISSNFSYCPVSWMFCGKRNSDKLEKCRKGLSVLCFLTIRDHIAIC